MSFYQPVAPAGANTEIQFNKGKGFGASPDLAWDDTGKVLEVGGDIDLDDGGTYTTTLQTITPTAARTISFPDVTGTVGLVGGSSGNLVVNQSGAYAGVANSSVDNATGNITLGSRFISSLNGAASAPPGTFTGTWFTGGTATTTKPQVLIEPTGATSTAWATAGTGLGVNAASGFAGRLLDLQLNGTSRAVVTGAGNVGIGTTSPASPLHVRSGGSGTVALFGDSAANNTLAVTRTTTNPSYIALAALTSVGAIQAGPALKLETTAADGTSAVERVRIDSSGRLLVGTSSSRSNWYNGGGRDPQIQLEQAGNTRLGITRTDNTNVGPELLFGKTRGSAYQAVASSDEIGEISFQGADGTELVEAASIKAEIDGTPGANDMPGRLMFSTTADGAASPTERMRITSTGQVRLAGAGITFNGDTATANELDDYEEGTWTPALVGTTAVTYSARQGKYVKIGRMVHVQALLQTSSQTFSSTAAALQISGLPFAPNDNTGYLGTTGSVNGQQLNFNNASNTAGQAGDYLNTVIISSNIAFNITTRGTTRGSVRNLGWGASGTAGCIAEFEITYYTTA